MRHLVGGLLGEARKKALKYRFLQLVYGGNLRKLAMYFGTDKWSEAEHQFYTPHYHQHFHKVRHQKLNVLEIGIGGYDDPYAGGSSLRMWKAYFPNSNIFGVDIHDKTPHDEFRIKTFKGSQIYESFMRQVVSEIGVIDIVIDDGSHFNKHVIETFTMLFPLISPDGMYAIEDLQTSYWERLDGIDWGGSIDLRASHTSMNFLKSLIDGLNHDEFMDASYAANYFDNHIVAMHFYHNMAFVQKGRNDDGGSPILAKPR
jgi:hypothetical protein